MHKFIYPSRIKISNLGDILINVLLIRELSGLGYVYLDGANQSIDTLIRINNPNEKNIKVVGGIKIFGGKPVLRWLNMLPLLLTASHVFDPPGAYGDNRNSVKSYLKFIKYYNRAIVLKLFGIDMIRIGVSMGPFSKDGLKRQKKISAVYKNIGVRDSTNFEYLQKNNFKNVRLAEDMAFLYNSQNYKEVFEKSQIQKSYVVVSVRPDLESAEFNATYIKGLLITIASLLSGIKNKAEIIFSYQVKEDLEAIAFMKDELEKQYGISGSVLKKQLSFSEAISLYYDACLVITNRLHVALLALLNNTLPVIVTETSEHHKLVNMFRDLDFNEFIFNIYQSAVILPDDSLEVSKLANFNSLSAQKRETIKKYLKEIL
ncbi:MAG TPA: polysaccharide pyruvyl transferase family protein [Parafilimonas sp.]|nr:polysaccharide pyruvyl transferase family protein [Parafilimonas sp.]